ncbi:hypothetical protein [uncultured Treponema sp.]|uniref:hypothetical protein n=1 Tax=uncultured Treponema sp. TaxID=162155 RepID=UPI0025CFD37A|nr:hypothetical protein [uncultured Treponema sp.]
MRLKVIAVFCFVFCTFFNSCYHSYADYVENINSSYDGGKYYLTWSPLEDAELYIVYAQYKSGEHTYFRTVCETVVPECVISESSVQYNCDCLRIVAVKDGHKSYLSEKVNL